jgi:hypothetical protein
MPDGTMPWNYFFRLAKIVIVKLTDAKFRRYFTIEILKIVKARCQVPKIAVSLARCRKE